MSVSNRLFASLAIVVGVSTYDLLSTTCHLQMHLWAMSVSAPLISKLYISLIMAVWNLVKILHSLVLCCGNHTLHAEEFRIIVKLYSYWTATFETRTFSIVNTLYHWWLFMIMTYQRLICNQEEDEKMLGSYKSLSLGLSLPLVRDVVLSFLL